MFCNHLKEHFKKMQGLTHMEFVPNPIEKTPMNQKISQSKEGMSMGEKSTPYSAYMLKVINV